MKRWTRSYIYVALLIIQACSPVTAWHDSRAVSAPDIIPDVYLPAEVCVTKLSKCGGLSWTGGTSCCDSSTTCMMKDESYWQCRSDCPSGWACEANMKEDDSKATTSSNDMNDQDKFSISGSCASSLGKCGGLSWTGVSECCESSEACFVKDASYSECRSSCPSGWSCDEMESVAEIVMETDITIPSTDLDDTSDSTNVPVVTKEDDATNVDDYTPVWDSSHSNVHNTISDTPVDQIPTVADDKESIDVMDSNDSGDTWTKSTDSTNSLDASDSDDTSLVSLSSNDMIETYEAAGSGAENLEQNNMDNNLSDFMENITDTDVSVDTDYTDSPPNALNPESTTSATRDSETSEQISTEDVNCIDAQGKCGGAHWHGGTTCCDSTSYSCFVKDSSYSQCRASCPSGWDCAVESIEPLKTSSVEETVEEVSASVAKPSLSPSRKPTTPAPSKQPYPAPTKSPTHKPTMKPTQKPYPRPTYSPSPKPTTELFKQVRKYELKFDQYFITFMGTAFIIGFAYSFFQARALGQGKAWWNGTVAYPPKPGDDYGRAFALESGLILRNKLGVIEMCGSCVPWKNGALPDKVAASMEGPSVPSEGTPLRPEAGDRGDMLSGIGQVKLRKTVTKEPKTVSNKFADVGVSDKPVTVPGKKQLIPNDDENHRELAQSILDNRGLDHIIQMMKESLMLKRQLKTLGAAPVEVVDLDEAEQKMRDAVKRLIEGDASAETEIERWDNCIRMNPDYIKREEMKAQDWERDNKDRNRAALRHMRNLVPPNVNSCSVDDMVSRGLPPAAAKRIRENKAIWLVRFSPEHIKKLHIAELTSKYSHQGLDLVEMRAIYYMLPNEFDNDSDGKKADWRAMFRQRLQDLCARENSNTLSKADKRHRSYKDADMLRLFDPDSVIMPSNVHKSTAFKPTEKPKLNRSRSVYVSKRRDPSNGGPRDSPEASPPKSSSIPPRPPMSGLLAAVKEGGALKKKKLRRATVAR